MYKHCQILLEMFEFQRNIWKYRHFWNVGFSSFDGENPYSHSVETDGKNSSFVEQTSIFHLVFWILINGPS